MSNKWAIWQEATIKSRLLTVFSGEWGTEPHAHRQNTVVLRATDLDEEGHLNYNKGARRYIIDEKIQKKQLRQGDILLEASGGGPQTPVGRVALFKSNDVHESAPYVCSNFFRTLRPSPKVHPGFLFWRLHLLYKQPGIWNFQQQTTGIINLKFSDYLDQILLWPSLPEQRRIAAILDTLDEQVQRTEQLIAKLKLEKSGLLNDLLTHGIDEHGRLRDPFTHPEQFEDSPLGKIPKGWKIDSILNHVLLPQGQVDPKILPFRDWPLIAPDHIESGTGQLISVQTASQQRAISGKYCFLPGDVLYSKIRPYLRKAILADREGLCSADMYPLRSKASMNPHFLLATILGEHFSQFATSVSMRSGFPKINRKELSDYNFPLPPIYEQCIIADILEAHGTLIQAEEAHLAKLKLYKQGLMHDLLTGQVRVGESDVDVILPSMENSYTNLPVA